jgi:hypothetical protein
MDIDGLGESLAKSLIDAGLISTAADLYELEAQSVAMLERMGKKSAENLKVVRIPVSSWREFLLFHGFHDKITAIISTGEQA